MHSLHTLCQPEHTTWAMSELVLARDCLSPFVEAFPLLQGPIHVEYRVEVYCTILGDGFCKDGDILRIFQPSAMYAPKLYKSIILQL